MGIFLVIFMFAAWSSIFSLGKFALGSSSPVFFTAFRMLFGGVVLLSWIYIKNKSSLKINRKEALPLIFLSIFSIYLTNILELWGLQYLSAAKACFIYSLSPFFSTILSYIHFNEKTSKRKTFGMIIGFLGFVPVLLLEPGAEDILLIFSFISWPEIAVIGAAFFSVYGWILLRVLIKTHMISPVYTNGYSMLFGGALALVHSFFVDHWEPVPIMNGKFYSFFLIVFIVTLISNIICYNLYGFMLRKYTTTFLSFMGLLSPVFASIISSIFLGEKISWIIFYSTIVVSFGLFLIYKEEIKLGYIIRSRKNLHDIL